MGQERFSGVYKSGNEFVSLPPLIDTMKPAFLFTILIVWAFTSVAQVSDTAFSATIDVPSKSATEIKQLALNFSRNTDRFLITNDRVPDRDWALGRMVWYTRKSFRLGLQADTMQPTQIVNHLLIGFQSPGSGGCIQLMVVTADAVLTFSEHRSTVKIDNLKYFHFNTKGPPGTPSVGNYNKKCNQHGTITELYECEACPKSIAAIRRFINKSIEDLATEYKEYLIAQ
jgi:hypothetical protein